MVSGRDPTVATNLGLSSILVGRHTCGRSLVRWSGARKRDGVRDYFRDSSQTFTSHPSLLSLLMGIHPSTTQKNLLLLVLPSKTLI